MKNRSVKLKITVWLTTLMALLSGLLLVFMLSVSRTVLYQTSMTQLSQTVRENVAHVSMADKKLTLDDEFLFYEYGVYTLIYSRNEALMAGQLPVSFRVEEPFQNGLTRAVSVGNTQYLVLDLWLPMGWEDGVWVRGLLEAPESRQTAYNLLRAALIALPLFILLAALGSYRIAKRAFRPLESITATAAAINEARDLSRRIGLPPGKDEFSRLAAAFDQLFERLERSFEAEKQFTADASHELRTPVSIIKGACEYGLKYDETPEERRETLSMIHRQAAKMSDLIAQLLRMTRLEQGTEPAHMEPVDLGALVGELCAERDRQSEQLMLDLAGGVTVKGDPALLSLLVRNLVENAFKYGKPEGHVWVSAGQEGGEAFVSVRDDGIGIPAEEQEKIWQRFYQVDAARGDENSGVGLGLAMARQIAQLHGGSLTLESTSGEGSAFTLRLPRFEEAEPLLK